MTFELDDVTVAYSATETIEGVNAVAVLDGLWTRAVEGVCGIVLAGAFGTIKTWA